MPGIRELKSKLAATTELLSRTIDPIERTYLGGDIRELERLVELTSDELPDPPRCRRPKTALRAPRVEPNA